MWRRLRGRSGVNGNTTGWHQYTFTVSIPFNQTVLYKDGAVFATSTAPYSFSYGSSTTQLGVGGFSGSTISLVGSLDEVRVSGVVLSPSWVLTEYNNQSNPAGFASIGMETAGGSGFAATLATTYNSASQLTTTIPVSTLATLGTGTITVTNPTPGGGTSSGQTFTVATPTIAYDNSASYSTSSVNSFSFNETVGAGSNRVLVCDFWSNDQYGAPTVSYAGAPMTLIAQGAGYNEDMYYWLANPASGTNLVAATEPLGIYSTQYMACASYSGVSQSRPTNYAIASFSGAGTMTMPLTTQNNNAWLSAATYIGTGDNGTASAGVFRQQSGGNGIMDSNSSESPAGSYNLKTSTDGAGSVGVIVELDP